MRMVCTAKNPRARQKKSANPCRGMYPSLRFQLPCRHPPLWVPPNAKYKTECPISVRDTLSLVQIVKKAALIPASKYVRIASSSVREKSRIRAAYMRFGKGYVFFHFITWSIRRVSGKDFLSIILSFCIIMILEMCEYSRYFDPVMK